MATVPIPLDAKLVDAVPLREVREMVLGSVATGIICPCCLRWAKEYNRKLNSGMAASLCWLYRQRRKGWVDVANGPKYILKSREIGKLEHWGLVQRKPHKEGDQGKKFSGFWRITEMGERFVKGLTVEPSHVVLYANVLQDVSDKLTTIIEALGDKFDYNELMEGA